MSQQDETSPVLAYIRHQASKSLADLRVLAERTAADCDRCLDGVSEEQACFKTGDEWSVKEVLDHMIYATVRVINEPIRDLRDGKAPRPYAPDASGGLATRPLHELRGKMARLLADNVALVGSLSERDIPPETWEHPTLGPLTIKELVALHRLHMMDHVQQIEKIKQSQSYPAT